MEKMNDIFRTFGPEYLERYGEAVPHEHRKALQAICDCRTEACGTALYRCEQCGEPHIYRTGVAVPLHPQPPAHVLLRHVQSFLRNPEEACFR
jgi:hypothetical protein